MVQPEDLRARAGEALRGCTRRATATGRRSATRSRPSEGRPSRFEGVSAPSAKPLPYRWVVLGVGSLATASLAAVQGGLPAVSPAIQDAFDLTLVQVTAVFTAFARRHGRDAARLGRGVRRARRAGDHRGGARRRVGRDVRRRELARLRGAARLDGARRDVRLGRDRARAGVPCSAGSRATSAGSRSASARPPCRPGRRSASFTLPPLASAAGVHAPLYALAGVMLVGGGGRGDLAARRAARGSAAPAAPDAARDPRIWRLERGQRRS